ncbi:protein FAM162B-like isoform X1 [Manacus candei]|uniref:protein FAM162B-like isoform X1 n=1 Tax=Manacus candei TaxID=415023 RepID=UPI0022274BBF|nr:protein FAM162B-like isoform X1 [Manacus candei]
MARLLGPWWSSAARGRMLGRPGGHSPGLWPRVARPVLCPARAVGNKARDAQHVALRAADPGKEAFRNDRRPTNFDKKVLVWAGRFKKEEDIPKHISSDVLDTARNVVRIKVCYIMIALTVLGCLTMVITGKEAAKKDQTLLRVNIEKKAKWRAEAEKDQEAAVGKPQ